LRRSYCRCQEDTSQRARASSFQLPAASFQLYKDAGLPFCAGSWKLRGTQISGRHISSIDEPSTSAASLQPPASSCDPEKGSAFASCNEFETEMLIAHDANFLPSDLHARYADDVCEVRRMLTSLIQTVG
jgi:hypothetical protein